MKIYNIATVAERRVLQSEFKRSEIGAINEKLERWLEGTYTIAYASINIDRIAQCTNAVGRFLVINLVINKQH